MRVKATSRPSWRKAGSPSTESCVRARLALPSVLLTFEPMPREYFAPDDPPARLTTLRERLAILASLGLDYTWLLRFGERLRNLSADGFAEFLARDVRARLVVVGHDFRFGKHGAASAPMLAAAVLFHFALMQALPAVSYLTRADKLMVGVYLSLFLNMLSTWFFFVVKPETIERVFRIARTLVPTATLIIMVFACVI